ncbi:MAG: hypothetical protein H5U40_08525, partial [Polyangiaceae bacterium]|nr:hypothetical protein [Polyangiaceae bacterium]
MLDDSTTDRKRRLVYAAAFAGALLLHFGVGVALGSVRPSIAHAVDQSFEPVEFTPIEPEPTPDP